MAECILKRKRQKIVWMKPLNPKTKNWSPNPISRYQTHFLSPLQPNRLFSTCTRCSNQWYNTHYVIIATQCC